MLSLRISKFAAKTYGYGYLGQKETFGRHGEDQKQGHETGTYRPPLLVPPGLPLSQECEEIAGYTRHCIAQIRHRDLHPWMFLARSRDGWPYSTQQHGLLEEENRTEQATGRTRQSATEGNGLAGNDHLGMSVETSCPRTDIARNGVPHQPHLSGAFQAQTT